MVPSLPAKSRKICPFSASFRFGKGADFHPASESKGLRKATHRRKTGLLIENVSGKEPFPGENQLFH